MNEQAIFQKLTSIDAYRIATGTFGDTTSADAITPPDTSVAVDGTLNFTDGDPIFVVGSGGLELDEIVGAPVGSPLVLRRPLMIAQDAGARIVEAVRLPLGHIGEDSATFSAASTSTPIPAATSSSPIGHFFVPGDLTGAFSLITMSPRSVAIAFGQAENTSGTGTSASPTQQLVNGQTIGTAGLLCFRAAGLLKDGTFCEVDFLDATVAGTATINISGKALRPIPVSFGCTGYIIRTWR